MKILEALVKNEEQLAKHADCIKFICSVNDDMYEEILTYNEILEYITKNEAKELGHGRCNVARQLHGVTSRRASLASAARKRRGQGSCLTLFSKNCFCDTFYLL